MEFFEKTIIARMALSGVLFILSFFNFLGGVGKLVVSLVAFLIIGIDILIESIKNILHGEVFDEKLLMLIASVGAFAIGEYHEAVAVMLFYQLGEFLQDLAVDKSKQNIKKLLDIRPDYANLVCGEGIKKVSPKDISVGDKIIIYAGEKIPLDAEIVEGTTTTDTSALTGESLPADAGVGDKIFAGTINLSGTVTAKVVSRFENTSVSKIIELVESAEGSQAKAENFITKFAKIYTPAVVVMALILAIFPPLAFNLAWSDWIHRALLFLVVSCPCALVISIPLTFFVGIGSASRHGILIKGANHIETLSKVDTIGFDKTGTLTNGNFAIQKVSALGCSETELLKIAGLAEIGSTHPIAQSVTSYAEQFVKLDSKHIKNQTNLAGFGVRAEIDKKEYYVGSAKLASSLKIDIPKVEEAGTTVFVMTKDKLLGFIVIGDEIKESSLNLAPKLRELGVNKLVMLTGDKFEVAKTVSKKIGINEFCSELLPEDKAKKIEELKLGGKVAFVGDGINDAPVLKLADVGIAMGKLGSDLAIDSADIVLMDDSVEKICDAVKISKKTMKLVKQNIVFTIGFKVLMLALGAFGLASMWMAVFADVGVSLLAILNSLRAVKFK